MMVAGTCVVQEGITQWNEAQRSSAIVNLYGVVKYNVNSAKRTGSSIRVNKESRDWTILNKTGLSRGQHVMCRSCDALNNAHYG